MFYAGVDPEPERNETQYAVYVAAEVRAELESNLDEDELRRDDYTRQQFVIRGILYACNQLATRFRAMCDHETSLACAHAAQLVLARG